MCKIELGRLPHNYVSQLSKGQELRQRTELPDTRPPSRQASGLTVQPPRPPTPEEGEIIDTPPPQQVIHHTAGLVGDGDVRSRTVIKTQPISSDSKSGRTMLSNVGDACGANIRGSAPKRKRNPSCGDLSNLSAVCSVDVKEKSSSERAERKKRKREHANKDGLTSRSSSSQVSSY